MTGFRTAKRAREGIPWTRLEILLTILAALGWFLLGWCVMERTHAESADTDPASVAPDSASIAWLQEQAVVARAEWLREKQRNVSCYWNGKEIHNGSTQTYVRSDHD